MHLPTPKGRTVGPSKRQDSPRASDCHLTPPKCTSKSPIERPIRPKHRLIHREQRKRPSLRRPRLEENLVGAYTHHRVSPAEQGTDSDKKYILCM